MFTKERGRWGVRVDKHGPISLGEVAGNRLPSQPEEKAPSVETPALGLRLSRRVINRCLKKPALGSGCALQENPVALRGTPCPLRDPGGGGMGKPGCLLKSLVPPSQTERRLNFFLGRGCRQRDLMGPQAGAESRRRRPLCFQPPHA